MSRLEKIFLTAVLIMAIFIVGLVCYNTAKTNEEPEISEEQKMAYYYQENAKLYAEPVTVDPVEMETEVEKYYDIPLSKDLQDHIFEVCEDYDVNHLVVLGIIERESVFNTNCIGDYGNSFGLMQIQPRWHSERMTKLGAEDLLDPYQNVLVGVDYLAELMSRGNGLEWALMAYNGGPTYANKKAAAGEVSEYVTIVLDNAKSLRKAV